MVDREAETANRDDGHGFEAYQKAFRLSRGVVILDLDNAPDQLDGLEDGLVDPTLVHGALSTETDLQVNGVGDTKPQPPGIPSGPSFEIHDPQGNLITPWRPDLDPEPPSSFDDITRGSTSQNNEQNLQINKEADDAYSEASSRFRANRSRYASRSWRRQPGNGSDSDKSDKVAQGEDAEAYDSDLDSHASREGVRHTREHAKKMWKWRSLATNRFENMLLECIVNIDNIPPNYENIFVDPGIIRQLERVTRLSLERKRAFSHGVLKGNRVTGAILWGPPGTGKSLLAKGLARQSGCNMLSISTAELWQKCHGEDEKVIKAVFAMGRKLHPCIIFVDEADAMLGARKAGEKRHLRSMLNQFLLDWDGLMSGMNSPFVLLATNRPFDLDPAVLRRAPVQIKLDIPTQSERQGILELLLRGEKLERSCEPVLLAKYTNKYTGSDLKNLCVTAATLCVDDQLEDTDVRTLKWEHFKKAMETIRPTTLNSTMKNEFKKFGKEEFKQENGRGHQEEDEE